MLPVRLFPPLAFLLLATFTLRAANDSYGDPLPAGAKLRLGTARMRTGFSSNPTALTPDGKFLVATVGGGSIAYLDPATGKTARSFQIKGEFGTIAGLSADGRRGVCTGFQGAFVVDTQTGKVLGSVKRPISFGEHSVSMSGDGKRLAAGGIKSDKENPTAVVWDVDGSKQIASVTPVQNQAVFVALSPDGKRLATWGSYFNPDAKGQPDEATDPNRTIQFWDAQSGKELGKGRASQSFNPVSIVFSPDGSVAAESTGNGLIQLFDPSSGAVKGILLGRSGAGRKLAFSPDGKTLAASGNDGAIQRWSLPEGKRVGVSEAPLPLNYNVQAIQFTDNERIVVWAGHGSVAFVWEVPSGKAISPEGGHYSGITGIATGNGGKELLSAASDGVVIRWDAATGKQLNSFKLKPPFNEFGSAGVSGLVVLSSDGTVALSNDAINGGLGVYDLATGKQQFVIPGDMNRQSAGSITPDGRKIVQVQTSFDIAKNPPRAVVWDIASATKLGGVELPGMNQVAAAISPDGKTLVTAGKRTTPAGKKKKDKGGEQFVVNGWELATGKKLGEYTEESAFNPAYVLPAGDNKSAIVATPKGQLVLIDAIAGKKVRDFDTGNIPSAVMPALSPDMKTVAVGQPLSFGPGGTAKILLFDIESGKLKRTLPGPHSDVTVLAFSPDGQSLFSGSSDTTVLMWELPAQ